MNVYNNNFSFIIFSYVFNHEEIIDKYNHEKTVISKYLYNDNFYILSLTKGSYLYIYERNNNTLKKANIDNINNGLFYNLFIYKFENKNLEFIISYINSDEINKLYQILFFRYKMSISVENCEITIVLNNTFIIKNKIDSIYYYYYYYEYDLIMTCQNIRNNFQGNNEIDILVCFYSTKSNKQLTATSFNIENNFQFINSTDFFSNDLFFLEIISSSFLINTKIIIHSNKYKKNNNKLDNIETSFFIYETQNNNLQLFYTINECRSIKNDFFNTIEKYILICYTDSSYKDYTDYK